MDDRRGVHMHVRVGYSSRRDNNSESEDSESESDDESKNLLASSSSGSDDDSDLSECSDVQPRDPVSKPSASKDDNPPNASPMDRPPMDESEYDEDQLDPPSPFILGIKPKLFSKKNHPGIVSYTNPKPCVATYCKN